MLQLYNSHYLVLYWKFRHIINVICFKQHQLVAMKHSLKFITMIVYKYIHIYIYICITGGPYLSTKPAITNKVNSVNVIELSNASEQATIWLSAHWCCLFAMHDLAISSWVSPLAFCVAVIWHSQESAEDTLHSGVGEWDQRVPGNGQQDHFRGFKNGLKLSWPTL